MPRTCVLTLALLLMRVCKLCMPRHSLAERNLQAEIVQATPYSHVIRTTSISPDKQGRRGCGRGKDMNKARKRPTSTPHQHLVPGHRGLLRSVRNVSTRSRRFSSGSTFYTIKLIRRRSAGLVAELSTSILGKYGKISFRELDRGSTGTGEQVPKAHNKELSCRLRVFGRCAHCGERCRASVEKFWYKLSRCSAYFIVSK